MNDLSPEAQMQIVLGDRAYRIARNDYFALQHFCQWHCFSGNKGESMAGYVLGHAFDTAGPLSSR